MPTSPMSKVIEHLRGAVLPREDADLTDGQLLGRFIDQHDEAAFAALVRRYGPMVLGVCRRLLRHHHNAEDAFQATFLVLVHKAAAIRPRELVGNWLYGVACRTALKARTLAARNARRERQVPDMPEPQAPPPEPVDDLRLLLDKELDCLPDKFRVPIVLCDLGGRSHKEAARHLGWPQGTVSGRLSVGRALLAKRLARRGLTLSVGALVALLSARTVSASVPPALLSSTVNAASLLAAGKAVTAGAISANVAALYQGVLQAMLLTKLKMTALGLLIVALVGLGTSRLTHQALAASSPEALTSAQERGREPDGPRPIAGKVVAVAKDGKLITLEIPPTARGEETTRADFKITDKTTVTYMGVGPNGAKPTEGYFAQVRVEPSAKDVAVDVIFQGQEARIGPDLTGSLVAVAKDGKGITLETQPKVRGEAGERIDLKLNDKTLLVFSAVAEGGAKMTEGYTAHVVLTDDAKGKTAAIVQLIGKEQAEQRGDRRPDLVSRVVAVAKDGKTITLEQPATARGEEPKQIDVKLSEKTSVIYHNVGPGGTKLGTGLRAHVWLEDGAKDSAAKVSVIGVVPERWATVGGKVIGISKDGNTLTLEQPAQARGEEGKHVEVKITADTRITYSRVGPDEAKLTLGYYAQARLLDDSKDTAAQLTLTKGGSEGRPGGGREGERGRVANVVSGLLTEIDPAKNTITLQTGRREEDPKSTTYELAKDAKIIVRQGRLSKEVKLADLAVKTPVQIRLDETKKFVQAIEVHVSTTDYGVVEDIDLANSTITLGAGRDPDAKGKTYQLAKDVKVFLRLPGPAAGREGRGAEAKEVKPGELTAKVAVALQLDDARKVVQSIQVNPPTLRGTVQTVDPDKRILAVRPARGDDMRLEVVKDVRILIDGKESRLVKLAAGTEAVLTLSLDRMRVLAIQTPPPEGRR
ncbi:MAG TPA: RNA polymerase sigma factor [Gemmataceae bacterium]|nr:RNA polymerase sigma factor [Gemmataceae bacterium]